MTLNIHELVMDTELGERVVGLQETVEKALSRVMRLGGLVVVDDARRVVGLLTEADVLNGFLRLGKDDVRWSRIEKVMSTDILIVHGTDDRLQSKIFDALVGKRVRILPVVDSERKLIAAVTAADLVRASWGRPPSRWRGSKYRLFGSGAKLPHEVAPHKGGILDYLGALYP
jgi:CBS domain-containing protein